LVGSSIENISIIVESDWSNVPDELEILYRSCLVSTVLMIDAAQGN